MKFRSIALILTLALSLVGWAQEAPAPSAAPNSTPATQPKSCCHHAAADARTPKAVVIMPPPVAAKTNAK
jgi:hypothetical protein